MPIVLDGTNGITQAEQFNSDSTFGFKNRIINGSQTIDQRNAGAAVTLSSNGSSFITDRFRADAPTDQSMTFQQQTSVIPTGFSYSLKVTAGTATTNVSNQPTLAHFIEGFNFADLGFGTANAKTFTLSFWVRSSLTGTFGVCFENNNADRGYIASYTINSANTFEYKTITIAGDTSGTWETTNQRGLAIFFDLGFGTTYSSAASTAWANIERGLTGGVKLAANTGATWFVTGCQLEVGSTATSFDYLDYGRSLIQCQRYFQQITGASGGSGYYGIGTGVAISSTTVDILAPLPVTMRAVPTASFSGTVLVYDATGNPAITTINTTYGGQSNIYMQVVGSGGGLTIGRSVYAYTSNATSAIFRFSAEL